MQARKHWEREGRGAPVPPSPAIPFSGGKIIILRQIRQHNLFSMWKTCETLVYLFNKT